MAFVPDPLPLQLTLDDTAVDLLAQASTAIGRLIGTTSRLVNPLLVASPLLHREAILSSRIEGTITTPEKLSVLEALGGAPSRTPTDPSTKEVLNYVNAMTHGLQRLPTLPISLRLIRELHEHLMDDVRGGSERPGEFRTVQNWIGRKGRPIQEARFVPPPVPEMKQALEALEEYLHTDTSIPLLVSCALIHYQFETIHPFRDGNGRVGRLLVPLLLCSRGAMPSPMLYLSSYFEARFDDYVDRMLDVSQKGKWLSWIHFFLTAVLECARESTSQAEALLTLREKWHGHFQAARSSGLLHKLVDHLFQVPSITVPLARDILGVTHPAAAANVRKLVEAGMLRPFNPNGRPTVYLSHPILAFMHDSGGKADDTRASAQTSDEQSRAPSAGEQ